MKPMASLVKGLELKADTVVRVLASLLVLAGMAYGAYLGDELRYPDEQEYFAIAVNVVDVGLYSMDGENPTAYRPPGYPVVMMPFIAMGAGVGVLRILNFVLLALSIILLGMLIPASQRALGKVLVALMVLCYPVLFYTAGTLYPQTVAAFLFLAFLVLVFRVPRMSSGRAACAGAVIGLLILTVSTFLFILGMSVLFLVFVRKEWRSAFVIGGVCAVMIGAWGLRNQAVFGKFIPFATNSGINLLLGNSPNTTANSGVNVDLSDYMDQTAGMTEVEKDDFLKQAAIDHMKHDPAATFTLYLEKVANFFNYKNELATASEGSFAKELLVLIPYAAMLLLVLWRLAQWRTRPLSDMEWFFILLYVMSAFFQGIFFTRIRFRLALDLLLLVIAADQLAYLLRRWAGHSEAEGSR